MHLSSSETRLCFGGFFGSSRNLGGKAAWGRVCGRAKLLAGTLRCLHLCWRLPLSRFDAKQLGRCPKPHKGRCPLTLQGALPLDPSARLSWSRFHAPSACSFLGLRLSPCLLPQLSVKNHTKPRIAAVFCPRQSGFYYRFSSTFTRNTPFSVSTVICPWYFFATVSTLSSPVPKPGWLVESNLPSRRESCPS